MRRALRGLIAIGGVLGCLVAGAAVAQDKPAAAPDKPAAAPDKPADNLEVLREKARADKKVIVAAALELTEAEAKGFWPVYNAYQSDMVTHYDKLMKLLDEFGQAQGSMTDQTAARLLKSYLALETDHLGLLKAYLPRFQKVLPAIKVGRLYQVENKLRAIVNYELARQIPLAQ